MLCPEVWSGKSRPHKGIPGSLKAAFPLQGALKSPHFSQHPFSGRLCCISCLCSTVFAAVGLHSGRWLLHACKHERGPERLAYLILEKTNASSLLVGPSGKLGIKDPFPFLQNTEILEGKREGRQSHYNSSFP